MYSYTPPPTAEENLGEYRAGYPSSADGELDDDAFLSAHRVRIANQGHAPIAAATQAVYATLKALREGVKPKALAGLPSAELTARVMREDDTKRRLAGWLGLDG